MRERRTEMLIPPPARVFPLVRHLSYRLTRVVYRLRLSANQLTTASLGCGTVRLPDDSYWRWLGYPAALGADAYWLAQFLSGARGHHV